MKMLSNGDGFLEEENLTSKWCDQVKTWASSRKVKTNPPFRVGSGFSDNKVHLSKPHKKTGHVKKICHVFVLEK